jgi:hypothetical protein
MDLRIAEATLLLSETQTPATMKILLLNSSETYI